MSRSFLATACLPISAGRWPMKITPSARSAPVLRLLPGSRASRRPLARRFNRASGSRAAAWSSAILPEAGCSTAAKWRARRPISPRAFRASPKPGQIVIADNTRRLAGHAFEFEDLGAHELKGFQHRVPVFRVASERDVESRFDATRGEVALAIRGPQQRNRHPPRPVGTRQGRPGPGGVCERRGGDWKVPLAGSADRASAG